MCDNHENELNRLVEIYKEMGAQKRHYDNICWTIGGVVLPAVGVVMGYAIQNTSLMFPLCIFSITILIAWNLIYDRLGHHASRLTNMMKDIERRLGVQEVNKIKHINRIVLVWIEILNCTFKWHVRCMRWLVTGITITIILSIMSHYCCCCHCCCF